jgi:hypothetical protein
MTRFKIVQGSAAGASTPDRLRDLDHATKLSFLIGDGERIAQEVAAKAAVSMALDANG